MSGIHYLYSIENMTTCVPLSHYYFSEISSTTPTFTLTVNTPNHQLITRLWNTGRHLLVYTKSRVYYMRRGKLRLWRKL